MNIYEKVKNFIEWSDNVMLLRNIAIELMDGSSYETIYQNYQKQIDEFLN